MSRQFVDLEMHKDGMHIDAEKSSVVCEAPGCSNVVTINESYSFLGTFFATTGPKSIDPFILDDEQEQDFCCSPECALESLIRRGKRFVEKIKELEEKSPYQVGSGSKESVI